MDDARLIADDDSDLAELEELLAAWRAAKHRNLAIMKWVLPRALCGLATLFTFALLAWALFGDPA